MINPDIKREEILRLIKEKGLDLVLGQIKTLLELKTGQMLKERVYIKDRADRAGRKIEEISSMIEDIEPLVIQSANTLNDHERERNALASKSEKLKEMRGKLAELSERKKLIESREEAAGNLLKKQKKLRKRYNDNLQRKKEIREKLESETARLNRLNKSITSLTDKRDMFVSKMPQYSDPGELKKAQGETKKNIKKYTADSVKYKKQLTAARPGLTRLKKQAKEKSNEMDNLLSTRNELLEKISGLESLGDRETITLEVNALKDRKKLLTGDIAKGTAEIKRLESKIIKLEKDIEKERKFEETAGEIMGNLMSQKKEIDNAGNLIRKLNIDIASNKKFIEVAGSINSYLKPLNVSYGSVADAYKKALGGLIKTIEERS